MGDVFKGFKKGKRILSKAKSTIFSRYVACEEERGLNTLVPVIIKRGKGPYLYDYDGNRFVDFYMSDGSLLTGHAHPRITKTFKSWLGRGYAAGYLTAAHELLARRFFHLYLGNTSWKHDELKWIFVDSPEAAKNALFSLLSANGCTGRAFFVDDAKGLHRVDKIDRNTEVFSEDLRSFSRSQLRNGDLVVFTFDASLSEHDVELIFKRLHEKGVFIATDETNFFSYLRYRAHPNLLSRVCARIFGPWTVSGFSFGAIAVKKGVFEEKGDNSDFPRLHETLWLVSSPPLHKIKAATTFTHLLETHGGIGGLIELQETFFNRLNSEYFEQTDGMIFVKWGPEPAQNFERYYLLLLEKGFYFPLVYVSPLALSYAHTEELLNKCAEKLNSIFQSIDR